VPTPTDPLVIAPENAERLTQLAQFGKGIIKSIRWSPDGATFAVASSTGIHLYDEETLQEVSTLGNATPYMVDFSFSPQGDALVVFNCDLGCAAEVWDSASGQPLHYLDTWTMPVFTSDGQRIVYAFPAAGPLFWEDFRTGERQGTIQLELRQSSQVVFGPGGELLAEVNTEDEQERTLHLWNTASGQLLHTIDAPVYSVAFSPQGDLMATSGEGGIVRVWAVPGGELLREVEGVGGTVVFSPDSRVLAESNSRTVRLWDMVSGQLLHRLTLPPGPQCGSGNLAFSPSGRELAVVAGSSVLFFEVTSGELQRYLEGYCFASDAVFSPDSSALITAGGYDIRTVDVHSGELLHTRQSDELVGRIAISPDGGLMAWGGGGQQYWLQVWDRLAEQLLYTIEEEAAPVQEVGFSPDGQLLATQSWNGEEPVVQVREAGNGKLLFGHEASRFAFSPDGRLLATSLEPYSLEKTSIELWDVTTFQPVRRLEGLTLLGFGADGNILAKSTETTDWWWASVSGELLRPLEMDNPPHKAIAFSPDGRLLLGIPSAGLYLPIWNLMTGQELPSPANGGTGTFSPDGRLLATVGDGGVVRLWGLEIGD
jgi:WD40 repeat protein